MNLHEAKQRILNVIEQEVDQCKNKNELAELLFKRFQDETRTDALAIIDEDWTLFGLTHDELTLVQQECERQASNHSTGSYGDELSETEIWEIEDDPDDKIARIRIREGYENEDTNVINTTYTYTHINELQTRLKD